MNSPRPFALFALLTGACTFVAPLHAHEDSLVTAVYSRTQPGYHRTRNADGTYQHQTYVVAKGGFIPGQTADPSIDPVPFAGIMRTMAPYLAKQDFLPARAGKNADLMLVVYWGITTPFDGGQYHEFVNQTGSQLSTFQNAQRASQVGPYRAWGPREPINPEIDEPDPQITDTLLGVAANQLEDSLIQIGVANTARDKANEKNANLLGYLDEINNRNDITRYVAAGADYRDLIADLEEPRYYVVIGAYDFQEALKHNRQKLLWSTRVSIRAHGNRFDERLAAMLANAGRYFGQDSGHLVRRYERAPRVDLGELKSLGLVTEASFQEK